MFIGGNGSVLDKENNIYREGNITVNSNNFILNGQGIKIVDGIKSVGVFEKDVLIDGYGVVVFGEIRITGDFKNKCWVGGKGSIYSMTKKVLLDGSFDLLSHNHCIFTGEASYFVEDKRACYCKLNRYEFVLDKYGPPYYEVFKSPDSIFYGNGDSYEKTRIDPIANGTYKWSNGVTYKGIFDNDKLLPAKGLCNQYWDDPTEYYITKALTNRKIGSKSLNYGPNAKDNDITSYSKSGIFYFKDGSSFQSKTADANYPEAIIKYPNGDTYVGEVIFGIRDGSGTYKYKRTGIEITGLFENGWITTGVCVYLGKKYTIKDGNHYLTESAFFRPNRIDLQDLYPDIVSENTMQFYLDAKKKTE